MKREFKIGDRVAVYRGAPACETGLISGLHTDGTLLVKISGYPFWCHPKQLRHIRIIKKKKPREWWINESALRQHYSTEGLHLRTTPPDDMTGWIHVVEQAK